MHCYSVLAETGRITGFLVAIQRVSMRPIRETKSQPRPMHGLLIASGRCARRKIYSQLRWTRPLPSGPWTCPPYPLRRRAVRRLAATERRLLRSSATRRMRSGACAPLRAGHILAPAPDRGSARAAPWRFRAPRLGGSAAPAHAAAARCSAASAPAPDRGSARAAPWRLRAPRLCGSAAPAHAAAASVSAQKRGSPRGFSLPFDGS